jgi:hypothetical protein
MNAAPPAAGLCATCQHARVMTNDRGSQFVMCERSKTDAAFPKYPRLPVLACVGYEGRHEKRFGK